jgi:O-methyltransferase
MLSPVLPSTDSPELLYLDLLKKCLTRWLFAEDYQPIPQPVGMREHLFASWPLRALLGRRLGVVRRCPFDPKLREEGRDWPGAADTMVGLRRLQNLQDCILDILHNDVPGDLIETGVWRGGASIFMRAVLKVFGDSQRNVWLADSFQGLPPPDGERFPVDRHDMHWKHAHLAVSLEQVQANFQRYGLLDDRVRFLVGWFRDTLPTAPVERLSLLRLDGDMYESTIEALRALYPRLSPGGYVVVDDYGAVPGCREAVHDYRSAESITEPLEQIDWTGVFWRRRRHEEESTEQFHR